jgi:hypothetical protein
LLLYVKSTVPKWFRFRRQSSESQVFYRIKWVYMQHFSFSSVVFIFLQILYRKTNVLILYKTSKCINFLLYEKKIYIYREKGALLLFYHIRYESINRVYWSIANNKKRKLKYSFCCCRQTENEPSYYLRERLSVYMYNELKIVSLPKWAYVWRIICSHIHLE